jgi:hypothetical protein
MPNRGWFCGEHDISPDGALCWRLRAKDVMAKELRFDAASGEKRSRPVRPNL